MNPLNSDTAAVVQRQLEAYNARDLATLMAIYADEAVMYEHPDKLLAQSTALPRASANQTCTPCLYTGS